LLSLTDRTALREIAERATKLADRASVREVSKRERERDRTRSVEGVTQLDVSSAHIELYRRLATW